MAQFNIHLCLPAGDNNTPFDWARYTLDRSPVLYRVSAIGSIQNCDVTHLLVRSHYKDLSEVFLLSPCWHF